MNAPDVLRFPPKVIVFDPLLTPVPPYVPVARDKNASDPRVPPAPIFSVELSVPARVNVLLTVNVLDVVPPAAEKPVAFAVNVMPLTVVGVIAPSVRLIAGVVVAVATVPETPFAVVTDTLVTVPVVTVAHVPSPRRYVDADGVPVTAATAVTELKRLPETGKVTLVVAVDVRVVLNAPDVVRFPPNVIVLDPLLTPVPPLADGRIPVTPVVRGNPVAFVKVPADGVPSAPPLTTNAPADPVLIASAVNTPVPVVVVAGAAPAPPPMTIAFAARAADVAHVEAELK